MSIPVVLTAPAHPDGDMRSRIPFWHVRSFTRPIGLSDPLDPTWPEGVSEENAELSLFI